MATFTLREVLDAIEKNGYPQAKYVYDRGDGSYCAIGQGAKNLNVAPLSLAHALNLFTRTHEDGYKVFLANEIFNANDDRGLTCQEIAAEFRAHYSNSLDKEVEVG